MNTDLAAQKALDRLKKGEFETLSEQDKILATVWTFEAQVANRGFAKYFASAAGDLAFYAPTAFATIGAPKLADIAAKANEAFGPAGPPMDRETRRALVEDFDPETQAGFEALYAQYLHCPEDLDDLLDAHLNKR